MAKQIEAQATSWGKTEETVTIGSAGEWYDDVTTKLREVQAQYRDKAAHFDAQAFGDRAVEMKLAAAYCTRAAEQIQVLIVKGSHE